MKVRLLFESLSSILETDNMFMSELKPTAGGGMVSVLFDEQTFFVKIESTEPDKVKVWMDSNLIVNQNFDIINENVDEPGIRRIASEISQAIFTASGHASAASSSAHAQFIKQSNIAPTEVKRVEAMQRLLEDFSVAFRKYGVDVTSSDITENGILMNIRRGDDRTNKLGVQFHGKDVHCSLNGVRLLELITFDEFTLSSVQILQILDAVMGKLISDYALNESTDELASATGRARPGPGRLRPGRDARGGNRIYDVEPEGLDDSSADGMAARGRAAGALDTKAFFQMMLRLLNIVVGDDKAPLDDETIRILRQIMDAIRLATGPT